MEGFGRVLGTLDKRLPERTTKVENLKPKLYSYRSPSLLGLRLVSQPRSGIILLSPGSVGPCVSEQLPAYSYRSFVGDEGFRYLRIP